MVSYGVNECYCVAMGEGYMESKCGHRLQKYVPYNHRYFYCQFVKSLT